MQSGLDEDLKAFISGSLSSVWALELLLLLRRESGRRWAEADLVAEMRASTTLIREAMTGLERAGLIRCDPDHGCTYSPASDSLDAACAQLEAAHKQRPVAVVNVILSTPKGTLQTFADAFRVKGRGEGE